MQSTDSTLSKRRRFQSSITTYFTSSDSTDSNSSLSHNHYSAATFSATPVLPDKVQSSLLSVGMRVRKSVADGYKTQIAIEKEKAKVTSNMATTTQPYAQPSYSELAPFSGLVGPSHSLVTDDDAFSLPPSSQESVASSISGPITLNGQKRRLDGENSIFADEDSDLEDEEIQSWRTAPLGRTILSPSLGQQRRRALAARQKSSFNEPATMDLDDFEEASFLRRREEVDADYQMDCA
ncbi:hypothetical protein N7478_012267 [Penicillium angulare]|uniref:uncharacterized protein n=1 Tax=Penicillium angulare TaxID=116970 RepID=UPI00254206D8|nr:uncharacterized protein N7478_012267 [Penicillium angulare]KAJ5259286.1 hypothetical protein N7478_012267 [Penicillium angulare]